MTVLALVTDLMDRSRIESALPVPVRFVSELDASAPGDATVVLADLRRVADPAALRALVPDARIIAFGSHIDDEALEAARRAGFDEVLARSAFFRRLAQLIE
jgi:hypothetical protein